MTTVYAAAREGLLVATGGDGDWTVRERLAGTRLQCVDAAPAAPGRAFCGTFEQGLWRSTDGGDAWHRVGADVLDDPVMAVAVSPHDPDVVWAGTEPSAVYRSTDGGDAWAERPGVADLPSADEWFFPPRPDTHHVRWIEPDPHDPDRLYVGIELGALVRTDDAGETWRDRPSGARRDNHSLATHPAAPGRVYAAAGDGYAESADGGDTWDYPQAGLDHRYCWSVAPDPSDPDTVLISSASGAGTAHRVSSADAHVYRRRGDGPWEHLDGLPSGDGVVRAVLATAGAPGEFFAVDNEGAFRTTDAGDAWDRLDVGWAERFEQPVPAGLAVVRPDREGI